MTPQVETVGDKYMAVSGLPEPCQQHARCIARLALDMMDLCKEVIVDDNPVVISICLLRIASITSIMRHHQLTCVYMFAFPDRE